MQVPQINPAAVKGLELNHYAAELARVTIWIGEIQWMLQNGFAYLRDPILRPLESIQSVDAILDLHDPHGPQEPDWPEAEVIVGNPPFLGGKFLRRDLGDEYVDSLFQVYAGRVPHEADLVTYWFEKARGMVDEGRVKRVGLLGTQGIRGGASRRVLQRIKETGDIFMAWSDRRWILEGTAVRVSFVAFDLGVWTGPDLTGLESIACGDDGLTLGATVVFRAQAAVTYYIQVGGLFGEAGSLLFRMREVEAGLIEGTVTQEGTGTPLAGMCVLTFDRDIISAQFTVTGSDGSYEFAVRAGSYLVAFIDFCDASDDHIAELYDETSPSHNPRTPPPWTSPCRAW